MRLDLTIPQAMVLLAVAAEALNDAAVLHTVLDDTEHDNLGIAARRLSWAIQDDPGGA